MFFFADDESLVDANRMKKLAELISEAGINTDFRRLFNRHN